ncbi:MAG: TIGR04283 family arsenosugar biosynthesis glycosyltransferase [Alphaproteobacteria bacterium]
MALQGFKGGNPALSIVIPTLNEAAGLATCIADLQKDAPDVAYEIIISDGASDDDTVEEARGLGCQIVRTLRGRGLQLAAGAAEARGDWLLFLHADTSLAPGWWAATKAFMDGPENLYNAAAFRFRLDDDDWAASILEGLVSLRCRLLSLPYGDQGLLISAKFYHDIGGYMPIVLMEDVDMVRRIGSGSIKLLDVDAVTSSDRYRRDGYLFRPLRNLLCLFLYFIGVPPRYLLRLYG